MSFTEDFLKELNSDSNKKRKRIREATKLAGDDFTRAFLRELATEDEEEDIAPTVNTIVEEPEEELKWYEKGMFADGYDFGDITKTLLGIEDKKTVKTFQAPDTTDTLEELKKKQQYYSGRTWNNSEQLAESLKATQQYNQMALAQYSDTLSKTKMPGKSHSVLEEIEILANMKSGEAKDARKDAVLKKMESLGMDSSFYSHFAGDGEFDWGTFGDWLKNASMAGLNTFNKGLLDTADVLLGAPLREMGWENNPISKGAEYYNTLYSTYRYNADMLAEKMGGGAWNFGSDAVEGTLGALPNALLLFMTGGASATTSTSSLMNQAAMSTGNVLTKAGLTTEQMMKNPQFWMSFSRTLGSDYKEAKEQGASDLAASFGSVLTSMLNAGIEIGPDGGSGIQGLREGLKSGKPVWEWVESSLEEGGEEMLQKFVGEAIAKVGYGSDKEILNPMEYAKEGLLGTISGAALGGGQTVVQSGVNAYNEHQADKLTQGEQAVADKIIEKRISEKEKNGKLTAKEKSDIKEEVERNLRKGYLTAEEIEEAIGGEAYETFKAERDNFFGSDNYKNYQKAFKQEQEAKKEFDSLVKMKQGEMTGEQIYRRDDLKKFLEESKVGEMKSALDKDAQRVIGIRNQMRSQMMQAVQGTRLAETYRELERSKQKFQVDVNQYQNENARKTVESILASGLGDNSNQFHETVDWLAKLSEERNVTFDLTKTERLKGTKHYREGYVTNGFKTTVDGKTNITVNLDGNYLNTTVGHEITHVLEEAGAYKELANAVRNYAISKEGQEAFDARMNAIKEIYGEDQATIDSEITADIIGEYLFTDYNFVHNLSTKNRNVFQKIYDEIKYMVKIATAGSKEARELVKVQKMFDKAWKDTKGKAEVKTEAETERIIDVENEQDLDYESPDKYSISVKDPETIDFLENQEHITTYKAMVLIDGKLYPPMASKVKGEDGKYHMTNGRELGEWMQAEEDTTNIKFNDKGVGYYDLKKDDGGTVRAAYNPYEHSSNLVLNDQFEAAYKRGNLVTVECVIPKSEIDNPYKAEYAKDSTGMMDWHSGTVAGKLEDNKRSVYLSRYLKVNRIVPDSEVAQMYKDIVGDMAVPFNVVSPGLLTELENAGVNIDYDGSPQYQYLQRKAAEREAKKAAMADLAQGVLDSRSIQYSYSAIPSHKKSLEKNFDFENASLDLETINKRYDKIISTWEKLGGELDSKFLNDWNNKVERPFTIFKAQSGYKYNVELSSMCKKGVPLFEAIDTIVKKEIMKELDMDVMGKEEKEILYDILKQKNFEIPCAICYVEQARQREGVVIDAFLNGKAATDKKGADVKLGWNQVLDSIQKEMKANGVDYTFNFVSREIATDKYIPAESNMDEQTYAAFAEAVKKIANEEITRYNNAKGKKRPLLKEVTPEAVNECFKGALPSNLKIFKILLTEPSSRFKIQNDLLYSSMTTKNLTMAHNGLYSLFNSQGGVSGYKTKQAPTVYWGEILNKKWKPEDTRKEGGVRNQSNSDFQMYTLLDQAQMYMDFSAKGYYLQAYTKVLSELKLFGLSRGKINASLIPQVKLYRNSDGTVDVEKTMENAGLDENGNPIYDDIEGINHNEAFMLLEDPEYSKNIGGICIGYSDNHIRKLLDDSRVQLIIGFHDKTNDPNKRYRGARYAKNYNGLNEATKLKADGTSETVHIGFNPFVKKAEKKFQYNKDTETFEGTVTYKGKTYTADDIPRLATDLYLEHCAKKGLAPAYDEFHTHPNYYKLLADFSLYDSEGHYAPHQKVAYNMPDSVPYLDADGNKQYMSSEEYIKIELQKELAVRDSLIDALADDSEDGIIPRFKAEVEKRKTAPTQYSMTKDSDGKELSEDQNEFFADSKARSENGDLYVLYHGSRSPLFTEFDLYEGVWLTPDQRYAEIYADQWHSWRDDFDDAPAREDLTGLEPSVYADPDYRLYKMYANITNPADIGELDGWLSDGKVNELAKALGIRPHELKPIAEHYMEERTYMLTRSHEFIELAKSKGFDGFMAMEGGHRTFCAFGSPNQVKLTTNEVPSGFHDVRYSMSKDSDGNQLTKEQEEFFKDSQMRDEDGNLKVMYHGSQNAGFHEFKISDDGISFFFTDSQEVAESYSGTDITYTAREFHTADELNKYLSDVRADEYEVREENGKFNLYEDGELYDESDTAQGMFDRFRNSIMMSVDNANYKTYLNIKNPFKVDAYGKSWDELPGLGENKYEYIKVLDTTGDKPKIEYALAGDLAPIVEEVDFYDKFDSNLANMLANMAPGEALYGADANPATTREYAQYAKENGYDGVIFENILDLGQYMTGDVSTVAVVFDSNQIKSTANQNPTGDPDIRYSMTKEEKAKMDNDYFAAIESGDEEVQKHLVREYAKASMPDSKLVDEDGNLRVVYHGTNTGDFTVFNPDYIGMSSGDDGFFGMGFYFAYSKGEASYYGAKRIIPAYLNLTNPFNFEKELHSYNGKRARYGHAPDAVALMNFADKFPDIAMHITMGAIKNGESSGKRISVFEFAKTFKDIIENKEFDYQEQLNEWGETETLVTADTQVHEYEYNGETHSYRDFGFQKRFTRDADILDVAYEYLSNAVYSYIDIPRFTSVILDNNREFTAELKNRGYDGTIQSEHGDEAVAFEPSQIKSAAPITRDENGNVIPLSKRFDSSNDDIRYSISKDGENTSGDWHISGKDFGDQDEFAEFAPIREDVAKNATTTTVSNMENVAPTTEKSSVTDEHPFKTTKEKLNEKLTNRQTELENIKKLRAEANKSYDEKIAQAKAQLDAKKNKDTKVANKLKMRIERLQRLKADIDAKYAKRIADINKSIGKTSEELEKDHTEKDRYARAKEKIERNLEMEKTALSEEYAWRKAELESKVSDKNAYFSNKARELYEELRNLRKGVRASTDLGSLLDFGYDWGNLRSALSNVRYNPAQTVNVNSVEESAVRQLINEAYENDVYAIDDLDLELSEKINELEVKADEDKKVARTATQRRAKQEEYTNLWENLIGDTSNWKDFALGITYKTKTLRRILRKVVRDGRGDPDFNLADDIYDELETKYDHNEAQLKMESKRLKEVFTKLNLNKYEDTYAHMVGELRHNPDTELSQDMVDEYYQKHKNRINSDKVETAITEARNTFDSLIERVNESLREQGMKEIPYRKGYFPHFTNPKQNWFQKLVNWKPINTEIPTSIAGLTQDFKPVKSWQSFAQQRRGDTTDYSLYQGLDTYIHGALDWIYHIEDIQKRRSLENWLRYTHSSEGIQQRIDKIKADDTLDANEAQDAIDVVLAESNNPLSGLVRELMNRTNTLANKKSSMDREMEDMFNRKVYSTMTNLNNRINANMVVGSLSSAMTNFIPMVQSWHQVSPAYTVKGLRDMIRSTIKDDGTIAKSDFLTNRLIEEEKLYKTGWDKASDKAAILMNAIDNITSQTVWRSKYLQNLSEGMSEASAIKDADQFAKNLIAGRSRGNMPSIFDAKNPLTKLFTAFQLEVANQYGYMFEDAPQDSPNKARLVKGYATAFLGAYVYNALYSSLVGRDAAFDPISIIQELIGDLMDDDEEPEEALAGFASNVIEEIPFVGSLIGGGRIPLSSAFPYSGDSAPFQSLMSDVESAWNEGNWTEGNWKPLAKEMLKPLYYLALPFGGGQIKKTNEGLGMFSEDHPIAGSYTDSGRLRFPVEDTVGNRVQAALFGQYSSDNARDYFDNGRSALTETQLNEFMDLDAPIQDYWEYRDGLKGMTKQADKLKYINGLDLTKAQKDVLKSYLFDEEGYKKENPEKYAFLEKEGIGYLGYKQADSDTQEAWSWAYSHQDEYQFYKENGVMPEDYRVYRVPMLDFKDESDTAVQWAFDNPEKATFGKVFGEGVREYRQYATELSAIRADKDSNGKTISGSAKRKKLDYINSLDIDYGMKLILFKSEYNADDTYNNEIIEYLNGRDDISFEETVSILRQLGFNVTDDGYITWD